MSAATQQRRRRQKQGPTQKMPSQEEIKRVYDLSRSWYAKTPITHAQLEFFVMGTWAYAQQFGPILRGITIQDPEAAGRTLVRFQTWIEGIPRVQKRARTKAEEKQGQLKLEELCKKREKEWSAKFHKAQAAAAKHEQQQKQKREAETTHAGNGGGATK